MQNEEGYISSTRWREIKEHPKTTRVNMEPSRHMQNPEIGYVSLADWKKIKEKEKWGTHSNNVHRKADSKKKKPAKVQKKPLPTKRNPAKKTRLTKRNPAKLT